jgi:hypothetical protein
MIGNSFNYKTVLVAAAAIVTLSGAWGVLSALEIRPVFLGEHLRGLKKIKTVHVIDLKVLGSDFYSSLIKKKKYDLYDLQQYRNKKLRQAFDSGWTQDEIQWEKVPDVFNYWCCMLLIHWVALCFAH